MTVESLVVKNACWIRAMARRYYNNSNDAYDLAGETIYKCLKNSRKFDNERSFKPWALAIMSNTYITQYNRRKCVLFSEYDSTCELFPCNENSDQRAMVLSILSVIRECRRKSCSIECVLLYAKGYEYEEIAKIIGIPCGTVKSRISYGRKIIKSALL